MTETPELTDTLLPASWLKQIDRYLLLLVAGVSIFLTFNIHRGGFIEGVIWSDQEGYYLYYPAVFLSENGFRQLPVGNCCTVFEDGRVYSKYTYGVALLEAPFVTVAHWIAKLKYDPDHPDEAHHKLYKTDGFSNIYAFGILFAVIFYLVIGLYFLKEVLKRFFPLGVALFTTFLVYFATNLLFYTVREAGMSHAYSFFLFSVFLYYLPGFLEKGDWKHSLILGAAYGLSVVIRPTNIIIGLLFLGYEVYNWQDLKTRFQLLFSKKYLGRLSVMAGLALVFALPQMIYWQYMNGKPVAYSYTGESFKFWNKPKIFHVWFSYQNGLFAYTPIALVAVIGGVVSLFKKQLSSPVIMVLFLIASYIFASWWAWWFGGAFGHRCYVEYYALLALPLGAVLHQVQKLHSRPLKWILCLAFLVLVYANIKMTILYAPPWDGPEWNLSRYLNEVIKPVLMVWKM